MRWCVWGGARVCGLCVRVCDDVYGVGRGCAGSVGDVAPAAEEGTSFPPSPSKVPRLPERPQGRFLLDLCSSSRSQSSPLTDIHT